MWCHHIFSKASRWLLVQQVRCPRSVLLSLGMMQGMDAPTQAQLVLYRLSAAAEENPQLQTLLRVCGATVQGISAELLRNDWRDVEVAVAISQMLDQIKSELVGEMLS
jgi:hypothetical protein